MTLPAAFYFLFFSAAASLFPFLALYFQSSLGLSGGQIGLLSGLSPMVTLVGAPLWTGLADATHRHKSILVLAVCGTVSVVVILPSLTSFAWLIPFICLYAFLSSPIVSLVDSATMSLLGERRDRYGRVRMWGTVGWGVVAPITGEVVERAGLQWSFWIYAILLFTALLVALPIPFRQSHASAPFIHGLRTLLSNRRWMLFLGMVFVCGVGMATVNTYLFIYMESLGASKTLMGIALTISTVSELPVMFFSSRLLRRLHPRGVMALAMLVIGVRLLLYSLTSLPWFILLIQLLHGLTFPAIWVAGVAYTAENAPPGMSATAQGIFGSTLMGFGAASGGLLGGYLLDQAGPVVMYRIIGMAVLACLLLFSILERRLVTSK